MGGWQCSPWHGHRFLRLCHISVCFIWGLFFFFLQSLFYFILIFFFQKFLSILVLLFEGKSGKHHLSRPLVTLLPIVQVPLAFWEISLPWAIWPTFPTFVLITVLSCCSAYISENFSTVVKFLRQDNFIQGLIWLTASVVENPERTVMQLESFPSGRSNQGLPLLLRPQPQTTVQFCRSSL